MWNVSYSSDSGVVIVSKDGFQYSKQFDNVTLDTDFTAFLAEANAGYATYKAKADFEASIVAKLNGVANPVVAPTEPPSGN